VAAPEQRVQRLGLFIGGRPHLVRGHTRRDPVDQDVQHLSPPHRVLVLLVDGLVDVGATYWQV